MIQENLLLDLFYYFGATVVCVPLFRACGLGSILGYLVAGIILGPHGLGLLHHAEHIREISQIGIIMLLFVIGLELTPARLKHLKNVIFGVGIAQFVVTASIFTLGIKLAGPSWVASFFVASALTLSSTAFALTWLRESDQLTRSFGQTSFGILIFQDLVIIPLLTVIPFFAATSSSSSINWHKLGFGAAAIIASITLGKFIIRPCLKKIYESQSKEIFIGTCLMIVIGASLLMEQAGLSKALGAFLAGIYLSGSGLRSDIQSFSVPIKAMMMGVFFMGFGLGFDVKFFFENWWTISLITVGFMGSKMVILLFIGRLTHGDWGNGAKLGLVLCQGGEFGFLVAAALAESSILPIEFSSYLLSCIALSIFAAPFLTKAIDLVKGQMIVSTETEVSSSNRILPFDRSKNETVEIVVEEKKIS